MLKNVAYIVKRYMPHCVSVKKINDFDSALVETWEKSLATYFESEFMKYPVIVIKKRNYFASKVNE